MLEPADSSQTKATLFSLATVFQYRNLSVTYLHSSRFLHWKFNSRNCAWQSLKSVGVVSKQLRWRPWYCPVECVCNIDTHKKGGVWSVTLCLLSCLLWPNSFFHGYCCPTVTLFLCFQLSQAFSWFSKASFSTNAFKWSVRQNWPPCLEKWNL